MTLTARLLCFFLSILALVLVGFSAALYLLADSHLHRQVEDRLDAVLNTIGGVTEAGADGVEWEPKTRNVNLDFSTSREQIVWVLADEQGNIIDRSKSGFIDDFLSDARPSLKFKPGENKQLKWKSANWEAGQLWIHSDPQSTTDFESVPPGSNDEEIKYSTVLVTAGISLTPVRATLGQLLKLLIALSLGIWLVAFFAGYFVCRRALLPLNRMAKAVREIDADDFANRRLPNVTSHDELEDLNKSFNNLLDRLHGAFERQRRFTGDASHQLRTPLTVILGQIEVILRRERSPEDYRQVLATVHQSASRLTRMVESLLFLARADSESRLPALEPLEMTRWLPEHLQKWSGHARFDDIIFESTVSEPCCINAQLVLLGELVNILLDNACKYSEPDTPIKVQLDIAGDFVFIKVEDQGSGMDSSDLANLFAPFCRSLLARHRGIEGVGLGLSIAKRLTEVFDGTLTVSSCLGVGSLFTLKFSLTTSNATENPLSYVTPLTTNPLTAQSE